MSHNIRFSPCWTHRRRQDLSGGHRKIRHQGLGPMTDVFEFHPLDQTWLQRPRGMRPCIGLNAGLLIRTHDRHPVCVQLWSLLTPLTNGFDSGIKWLWVLGAVMIEPIP